MVITQFEPNQAASGRELLVRSGRVIALRLFDLAYEIDLKRAEELWAAGARSASARARLAATPAKAVSFGVPPLALELAPVSVRIDQTDMIAGVTVRLYDFGIAAIALRLSANDLHWGALTRLAIQTDLALGPVAPTAIWDDVLRQLRMVLGEALVRATAVPLQEDYLITVVNRFDESVTATELQERADLVPLLSGEETPLSEGSRRDLLRLRFSYRPDDLVAVAWDRAFIYEPRGDADVADVLEIANAQLLEMRSYDEMLDAELPRMRGMVEAARRRADPLAARRYARLARSLHTLVAEVTEITERVDNALQVTEDVYLARVYAAAIDLFRVPIVTVAVERKLSIIRATYTALHEEAAGARAEMLEIAILALIAIEIILSFLR